MTKESRYAYCVAYDQYIFNASFHGVIDYKTGKIYGYQTDEPDVFSKAPMAERGRYTDYGDYWLYDYSDKSTEVPLPSSIDSFHKLKNYLHRKWWRAQQQSSKHENTVQLLIF